MRILQINTVVNSGSTGRIAEDIGKLVIANGHESFIAYGRGNGTSVSKLIKIGSNIDVYLHKLKTLIFDRHGFGSKKATIKLIKQIKKINPDVIHLHNIHGYYLNIEILFSYLKEVQKPVVWTFHDCWPFTGHCSYFDSVNCFKWKNECNNCPNLQAYPTSCWMDRSLRNFYDKKEVFLGLKKMQIVTPSKWLKTHVKDSFLKSYSAQTIHNGIDISVFMQTNLKATIQKFELQGKKIILGVASIWDKRKGLDDFISLSKSLSSEELIILIGLSATQIKSLPPRIVGIPRTENISELASLYAVASVFVNPTYVDNFPTTNLEALACGTPVITYNTGGSPEAIDDKTGIVVDKGDLSGLWNAVNIVLKNGKENYSKHCRLRAETLYNKEDRYKDYLNLYFKLMGENG
ncbi:MAG: glycosyltransferase [Salinivirgaceae bacterium]|nr:glycosyltransferase [Salinivirgaceae bacterium]